MSIRKLKRLLICIVVIVIALIWFFPIFYMVISSFKPEAQVVVPGIIFNPTLDNYREVFSDTFVECLRNSVLVTLLTVVITTVLAVPASYALVFVRLKNSDSTYFWFVSTTFLPAISVITPVYLIFQRAQLIDTPLALVLLYSGSGVPLMVWLVTNYFREIPMDLVEAAELDGCTKVQTFFHIMIPLIRNGLVSAMLLVFITTWNEFFFAVTLTYSESATLPVYMSKFMTQQGYFWGKMSAAGTLICLIPIILGFFTQKSLVKGMTAGASKG